MLALGQYLPTLNEVFVNWPLKKCFFMGNGILKTSTIRSQSWFISFTRDIKATVLNAQRY